MQQHDLFMHELQARLGIRVGGAGQGTASSAEDMKARRTSQARAIDRLYGAAGSCRRERNLAHPGPGAYGNPNMPSKLRLFAKFSAHKTPSALEAHVRAKQGIPGPSDYSLERAPRRGRGKGVRFAKLTPSTPPSPTAEMVFDEVPGPGHYGDVGVRAVGARGKGCRFSQSEHGYYARGSLNTNTLEAEIARQPGPADYQDARTTLLRDNVAGAKISAAEPMSTLDFVERKASETPAPGHYGLGSAYLVKHQPPGTKFPPSEVGSRRRRRDAGRGPGRGRAQGSTSRSKGRSPGPGSYIKPSTLNANGGKFAAEKLPIYGNRDVAGKRHEC